MQLQLSPHSTQGITRYPAQVLMTVEASTLGLRPGHVWERLYDDACDVGLALRSHKTGEVSTWYLCEGETKVDSEGDVQHWILKPTAESVRKHRGLDGYTLKIYND